MAPDAFDRVCEAAKDKELMAQMRAYMKYQFVPKDELIFDYDSQGDLFYMILAGRVSCKVPFYKQLILLSEDEKNLFVQEFKDDLMAI